MCKVSSEGIVLQTVYKQFPFVANNSLADVSVNNGIGTPSLVRSRGPSSRLGNTPAVTPGRANGLHLSDLSTVCLVAAGPACGYRRKKYTKEKGSQIII